MILYEAFFASGGVSEFRKTHRFDRCASIRVAENVATEMSVILIVSNRSPTSKGCPSSVSVTEIDEATGSSRSKVVF